MGLDPEFDKEEAHWTELTEADLDSDLFPVDRFQVAEATARDPVLKQVLRFVTLAWPLSVKALAEEIRPYWNKRNVIGFQKGVLL
ncbi:hypothetical protein TTRE_0000896001 [Trichuris trichiura]|uniref:Uncharacterized protein n=1 Tax=Trichuris trichiura TaxID=36087 RepID=A0A077ZJL3_TRITR|nr:hypothetical protein TTRE_0000896001 [Trichuris trichiura]